MPALRPGSISPPRTDTSAAGLAQAIEADSIGTRILNPEVPLEPHLEDDAAACPADRGPARLRRGGAPGGQPGGGGW